MDAPSQQPAPPELAAQAGAGDASAFWRLADDFRPYLRTVAARLVGGRLGTKVDASDVVQQGLLTAFEQRAQFRGSSAEQWRHWLVAIVRNQARNVLLYWARDKRDRQRDLPLATDSGGDYQVADDGSTPSQQLTKREQAAQLLAAIDRLPPDYRTVLHLRNFDNLPYADIARQMNRSEAAVRQLWERAVCRLRDEWGDGA